MGAGVTVAVCDTGVNASHPDLAGQVINGFNTASDNTDTSDINGHGTWVAGVIAAKANNLTGGASVAPVAKILAMRITNQTDSTAYASEMAECVTWAADHGARIANISYNGVAGSATVASAASYMMSLRGLVVVAAGNASSDMGYTNSPYLFTAAATDSSDNRPSWSNYGQYIDVAAPGVSIFTTDRSGGYAAVNGTSFSSPHTAATAALVMSANPDLSPTDVLSIITNTAKDLGSAGWDPYFGFGRVDTGAAVAMAATVQPSDRTAPSAALTTPTSGATVKGLVTVDVRATDDFGVMSVDLLADGVIVGTDTQEDPALPDVFRFAWDSTKLADGTHELSARARDAVGNVGSAQEVSITVKNAVDTTPPVVTSLNPTSGATVTGTATLSATASDNVGIASLTVSAPGAQCAAATTSVSCPWDTKALASGWYTVTATATDAVGYVNVKANSVYVQATTTTTTTTPTTDCVRNKAGKCKR
jgi:hypothetical protein